MSREHSADAAISVMNDDDLREVANQIKNHMKSGKPTEVRDAAFLKLIEDVLELKRQIKEMEGERLWS